MSHDHTGAAAASAPNSRLPRLTVGDAAVVLAQYSLPAVQAVRALAGGQAAKLQTAHGSLLLKRRPAAIAQRLSRVHAVIHEIAEPLVTTGLVVPAAMRCLRGETMVVAQGWVYDIAPWSEGERFDGTPHQAAEAGAALAQVHQALRTPAVSAMSGEFTTMTHAREPGPLTQPAARSLQREIALWLDHEQVWAGTSQVLHGDWHRGNVLFDQAGRVRAALDFELARTGPIIAEASSGAVQFATEIRTGTAEAWPAETDLSLVGQFVAGYLRSLPSRCFRRKTAVLTESYAKAAPVLMAGALLEQAAELESGDGVLTAAVIRKARWILDRHIEISEIFMP